MRYAYAITAALLVGGTTLALTSNSTSVVAQTAQNEGMSAAAPRGAPVSLADMVERLQPAVVNISTRQRVQVQNQNPFAGTPFGSLFGGDDGSGGAPQTRQAQSLGSGFIISPDGYIVTNNHVVAPGARGAIVDSITVILPDRTEYTAKLIGTDQRSDLAVLKIQAPKPLPFVKFGDSTRSRVGDWVVAIGNPFGIGSTVTAGIISALHRNTGGADRFIQTDASINQGNSGGPMFDMNGNVIGINSQILSPTGGNVGIGFAIPAEEAIPVIETLRKGGSVKRGYLGIQISQLSDDMADSLGLPKNRGEFVQSVEAGKGADKAGIKAGDVIVRVNGQSVTPDETLSYIISGQPVGATVPIDIIRNGKPMTVRALIGERPSEDELANFAQPSQDDFSDQDAQSVKQAAQQLLGIAVQTLTPNIARQLALPAETTGVVVTAVDPSTDAGAKGLRRGDVITQANYERVTNEADLNRLAQAAKDAKRSAVLLQVTRRGTPPAFVPIRLRGE
ncbi:Do family serine endopeptidase [Sphingobium nicotianae]|uniref:Probable periplasmic serine endoprotease DegP-like n=1 Tax=Sphingobium nicotianae TaxID=2782607 RepID=A0A9X1ISS2_9SPHN|nr:Do family serine endopeptidase [Sphingobium nicotianae]